MNLLTNSRMKCFRECTRKHYYRYVQGYRAVKTPWNLWFGTLIHACLEQYWLARQRGDDPMAYILRPLDAETEIDPIDRAKAMVMLAAYASVWNQTKCTVVGVEVQFDLPHTNPMTGEVSRVWRRAGKMDAIIRFGDGIALVEHKTSAADVSPGSDYRRRLTLDEQISFYWAGAESLGIAPSFVVYDILAKPKIKLQTAVTNVRMTKGKPAKPGTKRKPAGTPEELPRPCAGQRLTDETIDEYTERLAETYRENPDDKIIRVRVQRTIEERKRFHLTVWQTSQMMTMCEQFDMHPQNSDACFSHGSPCEFMEVCYGTADIRNPIEFKKLDSVTPELVAK